MLWYFSKNSFVKILMEVGVGNATFISGINLLCWKFFLQLWTKYFKDQIVIENIFAIRFYSINEKYSILLEFGKVSYKISTTLDHYMGKIEGWRIIGIHWTLLSSILVNNLWIKKRHKKTKTHKLENPWFLFMVRQEYIK